jgi:hypothetical protein
MVNRKLVLAVCGAAVFSVVFMTGAVVTADANKTAYLTFSKPVGLPGVALGSGTYIFEIANPDTSANVVRVLSRDRSISYFMGLTRPVDRPKSMKSDQGVSLGESAAGIAPSITAWWPLNESTGREFIYPRAH